MSAFKGGLPKSLHLYPSFLQFIASILQISSFFCSTFYCEIFEHFCFHVLRPLVHFLYILAAKQNIKLGERKLE